MKSEYRIEWRGRSMIATMLMLIPLTGFGAPILGVHVINGSETVGTGDTLLTLDSGFTGFEVARVPEPGTLLLMLSGLAGVILSRCRSVMPREEAPAVHPA